MGKTKIEMMPLDMPSKNVHIDLKRCLLPGCTNSFTPKGKGPKTKKFCSDECRKVWFRQARKAGQGALSALKELEE